MALPYVTAMQAEKIAKEVVKESGSQPGPAPADSFKLSEEFFKLTADIDLDNIDYATSCYIFKFNNEEEYADHTIPGHGYISKAYLQIGDDNKELIDEGFFVDFLNGSKSSDTSYTCSAYKISNLINHLTSNEHLILYDADLAIVTDEETGDSWLELSVTPRIEE